MTVADIVKSGSIFIPPDGRKCYIKRLKRDGTYDADWLDISEYVISYPTIEWSFGDDVFVGDFSDKDYSLQVNNATRKFNDVDESTSLFYGYRTRYKTLFKIEIYAEDENESLELLRGFYGISFTNPTVNDIGDMEFSISSTLKILNNYSASECLQTSADTETMVTRLMNLEKNGVKLFEAYFTGFKINPDSVAVTTLSKPYIEEKKSVLDKIRDYSFYDDFFYYVDDEGYFVWDSRTPTASVIWEFNGSGNTDSTYPTNIQTITSYYEDLDNTYTKIVLKCSENEIITRDFFSGIRYDDGTATYLSDANSITIYTWLDDNDYLATDSRLAHLYISSRTALDAYLDTSWSAYKTSILDKLTKTINGEDREIVKQLAWSIGDGSQADIYGEKIFSQDTPELSYSEGETIAQRILDNYKQPRTTVEAQVTTAFLLYPKDRVKLNYLGEINVANPFIVGVSKLGGGDVLAGRTGAIRLKEWVAKVSAIFVNFDNFDINITMRGV